MKVPDKKIVVHTINRKYNCKLSSIKRKQIMFQGISNNGQKIILCTPSSKVHVTGKGWFDLNTRQLELLDKADIAILAVRLEGDKIYFLDFKKLRKLMTKDVMLENYAEGNHWKLFVWDQYIQVQGQKQKFYVKPEMASPNFN